MWLEEKRFWISSKEEDSDEEIYANIEYEPENAAEPERAEIEPEKSGGAKSESGERLESEFEERSKRGERPTRLIQKGHTEA